MAELDNWIKVIELTGQTGWIAFYESLTHHPVSNIERLMWCVDSYGKWPTFEAILATQKKTFTSDPLAYIIAVAQAKWRDGYVVDSENAKYERGIERSKQRVQQQNEELEDKLRKAKESVQRTRNSKSP